MKKILRTIIFLLAGVSFQSKAQNSFTFACTRDTVINGCAATCIILKSRIPDVRSSTNSYVVNPMSSGPGGCFAPYIDPGLPGNPTNLTVDDTYSGVISIPFSFPFFGTPYTALVASTNGYISFDITNAGQFSHYTTATGDLPNTGYDRALIMGPYHDLDPAITTSPTQQIKYDLLGNAPHRKWILSFYKVPLFSTTCNTLFENTHQIVIYEGLGIAEVFVKDKQICNTWNNGQSMIGMQNYNRDAAIMVPGRKVSDQPWGSIGMNESWRFTPATGPTLYRKVELFDLGGTLISTGDTTSIGNNIFEVSFPNICPTATTTYIVKSTYADINNPLSFVYGTDTIRVVRSNALNVAASVVNVKCNSANDGSFTINPIGGTGPFQYSIDGGLTFQVSPTFSGLAGGTFNVKIKDIGSACIKDTSILITEPTALNLSASSVNATCSVTPNGTITVNGSGGVPGYNYSLDGITFQASGIFTVTAGAYTVTVKDANNCTKAIPVTVELTNDLSLQIIRSDTTICKGATVVLTTNSNATSYSWSPAATLNSATIANPVATPFTNTSYTVNATLGQCTKSSSVNISVKEDVQVYAGLDVTIISGDQVQFNATASNANTYLWTPSAGLSSVSILKPIAKPVTTTLYTLTVKNEIGCTASDDVLVKVIPYCIKVRNAFTPNGDGVNDLWLVYDNFECLRNVAVHVFNRYGNEVFVSKDYRNNWDGRFKGKSLPDGTYYAVVDFILISGKSFTTKTDLTILR